MVEKQLINVLLVEDNAGIAKLIEDILSKNNQYHYAITHEASLKPALEKIKQSPPDIVVLDLTLPDSSGFQTFLDVRAANSDIPVIIITGLDDESLAIRAVREGAQDYLVKSQMDMHILQRSIQYAIERNRIECALRRATLELEERVNERTAELSCANRELQREIEERIQAQSQLVQAAKMEVVGRLASGVAHEVRNPLAILLQGMEYLEGIVDTENEAISSTLLSMKKALERADTIINGLLDFSRASHLEMKPCDINQIVENAFILIKHQCDRSHIQVEKNFAQQLPSLNADRIKIEQVLVNLFINAIDAMPFGGVLRIETSLTKTSFGSAVCVQIHDTGSGIPPEHINNIFEPFLPPNAHRMGQGLAFQ